MKRFVTIVDDTNDRLKLMSVDACATDEEILQQYYEESAAEDHDYDPHTAVLGIFEGTIVDYVDAEE